MLRRNVSNALFSYQTMGQCIIYDCVILKLAEKIK